MSRFVRPETVRLPISDGDWLLVKKRLTSGEERAAFARTYIAGVDGRMHVNPISLGVGQVTAYLLEWSLTDDDGQIVDIRDKSADELAVVLDSLSPEDFTEIRDAIAAHDDAMRKERDEKKRQKAGTLTSGQTLPSPSDADGASIGSESLILTSAQSSLIS